MASSNSPLIFFMLSSYALIVVVSSYSDYIIVLDTGGEWKRDEGVGRRRVLLSLRDNPKEGNATFECSPSGGCIPCIYSEKNDENYRCSETGYHISLKCVEIQDKSNKGSENESSQGRRVVEILDEKAECGNKVGNVISNYDPEDLTARAKQRGLLGNPSTAVEGEPQSYITHRSCVPAVGEEKLSVMGFEGIVFILLIISGSVVQFRRKRPATTMSGVGGARIPTNSRF